MDIILLREAASILKYKARPSVLEWCKRLGVQIFTMEGSNRKYLLRLQFERARLKTIIAYLKKKYPENWKEVLRACWEMNITGLVELEGLGIGKFYYPKCEDYKPKGKQEKSFLSRLQKNSTEL